MVRKSMIYETWLVFFLLRNKNRSKLYIIFSQMIENLRDVWRRKEGGDRLSV
jgi:hypothetical protein